MKKKLNVNIRKTYVVCLLLVLATLAAYWQVKDHDFVDYDDDLYVVENPVVHTGMNQESVIWAFQTTYAANWHPLTWLSHLLDVQLYGLNAGQHHITNLIIHSINTVLLFITLRLITGALWRSAFVAALFALHPLHVESVAQVAGRKDVLSTLFWLLTLLAYAGYVKRPGKFRYVQVAVFFALGLMAKPMTVTLPFVLLLLDYWPFARFGAFGKDIGARILINKILGLVLEKLPLLLLSAVACAVTFWVQDKGGTVGSLITYPLDVRVSNALVSYITYIAKMIWPTHMAFFYPHPGMWPLWQIVGAFCLLFIISFVVISARKDRPFLLVGWLWYVGTLIPVIGLVQVGSQSMADRYTYVPLIGLFVMVSWGVDDISRTWRYKSTTLTAAAVSILSILTAITWIQASYWKNSLRLFEHALAVTSNNYAAHNNMGMTLKEMGQFEVAIRHYQKALQIDPKYAYAHNNWGNALSAMGNFAEAAEHYMAAIKINPHYAKAHYNLGNYFIGQDRIKKAISHYSSALRIDPHYAEAHNNLGTALALQGRSDEAVVHFRAALRIKPDYADAQINLKQFVKPEFLIKDIDSPK